jgi:hypothetical protein
MIISYAGPAGRQVVMADVNPGIGGLSAATMLTLEEFRAVPASAPGAAGPGLAAVPPPAQSSEGGSAPPSWRSGDDRPPPNLGPPPPRLDWRRRRP